MIAFAKARTFDDAFAKARRFNDTIYVLIQQFNYSSYDFIF